MTGLRDPGSLSDNYCADRGTDQTKNGTAAARYAVSPVILASALGVGLVPSTGSGATWFLCKKESII